MTDFAEIDFLIALSRTGNTPRARDARLALAERGDEALPLLLNAVLDDMLPGGGEFLPIIGEIGCAMDVKRTSEFMLTRENRLNGLHRGGGDNAARVLIEILNAPHLRRLRAAACEALGMTRSDLAVAALIGVIHDAPSHPAACGAVRALAEFWRNGANEAKQAAAKSASPYLRAAALFSLDIDEQIASLRDGDLYVRLAAIKLLRDPETLETDPWKMAPLRDCLAELKDDLRSSNPTTAAYAAVALAQSRSPETEEPLIEMLNFGSIPEVRRVAAVALGYMGTNDCAPDLLSALTTDKNERVRLAAAEALYRIGTVRCRAALVEMKSSVNEAMRKRIRDYLKN